MSKVITKVVTSKERVNNFLACDDFCDDLCKQLHYKPLYCRSVDRHNIGPDLDPKCLTGSSKNFLKKLIL